MILSFRLTDLESNDIVTPTVTIKWSHKLYFIITETVFTS